MVMEGRANTKEGFRYICEDVVLHMALCPPLQFLWLVLVHKRSVETWLAKYILPISEDEYKVEYVTKSPVNWVGFVDLLFLHDPVCLLLIPISLALTNFQIVVDPAFVVPAVEASALTATASNLRALASTMFTYAEELEQYTKE